MKAEIAAADYEAAAISAAMSMEEKAIQLYSERAAEAQDSNEKALYEWLARWETQHLKFLSDIDRELKEQVQKVIQTEITGRLDIQNLLGFLRYEIGLDRIRGKVTQPLSGLRLLTFRVSPARNGITRSEPRG